MRLLFCVKQWWVVEAMLTMFSYTRKVILFCAAQHSKKELRDQEHSEDRTELSCSPGWCLRCLSEVI